MGEGRRRGIAEQIGRDPELLQSLTILPDRARIQSKNPFFRVFVAAGAAPVAATPLSGRSCDFREIDKSRPLVGMGRPNCVSSGHGLAGDVSRLGVSVRRSGD